MTRHVVFCETCDRPFCPATVTATDEKTLEEKLDKFGWQVNENIARCPTCQVIEAPSD